MAFDMKSVFYAFTAAIIIPLSLHGEDFAAQLKEMSPSKPWQQIETFIKDSYEANKNDPAYYVASANYWWNLSLTPVISTKLSEKGDYMIVDPKTGKEAGSMSSEGQINPQLRENAVQLLQDALERFPNRIDIGMGLAYIFRELDREKNCLDVLLQVLKNAQNAPDTLQWKNGDPLPEPPNVFLPELMQKYTADFYRLETEKGDELCRSLCEAIIHAYPDHPYAYNILAALSSANQDDQGSVKYLLVAHQKAPKDSIVIMNLADAYRRLGDKKEAERYYKLALAIAPSAEAKAEVEAALLEINK